MYWQLGILVGAALNRKDFLLLVCQIQINWINYRQFLFGIRTIRPSGN